MSVLFSKIIALFTMLSVLFLTLFGVNPVLKYKTDEPVVHSSYSKGASGLVSNADFYVSVSGSDENDGTLESPFATIERAKTAVRNLDKEGRNGITVAVMKGEYRIKSIEFGAEDSGTAACPVTYRAYGDGEVVINGGVTLDVSGFGKVTDTEVLSRLSADARKKVLCCNLSDSGITAEQYGKIYAIGSYNTANKYTGDYTGPLYCELFVNDERQTIARYPNEGFLKTEKVISTGEGRESNGSLTLNPDWDSLVNPRSDVYEVNKGLADRINSWKTLDDVWMFGFWKYDWADASTLIGEFNAEKRTLSPKFVSVYGTKTGAPYYFFNVLEELDRPGEWYLDRENGILYLYPGENFAAATVDFSVSTDSLISGNGADYLTFDGFTLKGTRGDAIVITGSNNTVSNCLIKNIAGNAVYMNGSGNTVKDCEITRTGKGGISLTGGDTVTLTPGNNKAVNNFIHDWSELYQTYQAAVALGGVGNVCAHNEIYNSPHEAITYFGNNHLVEYNLIHDVCLLSDDAAAIYSGRSWVNYGTVVRYNCIYDLGSGEHAPTAIYFDDALSGQTAYGNLLVNIPAHGFLIGGGRDMNVTGNIIVNSGKEAIYYDQRAIDGVNGGWFTHASKQDGSMWQALNNSPWQSDAWKNAYPEMQRFSRDFDNQDDINFVANPSYSNVSGNIIVNFSGNEGTFEEKVRKFSTVSDNYAASILDRDKIFVNPAQGDYSLKDNSPALETVKSFTPIPCDKIGRYNGT